MDNTTSLETKYQNLAAEYSKLRANATVLKKAVLDEQAKTREMKENLKEHEQKLRKSNQEMESLTFRNQQLTKRISVLQQELEVRTSSKKVKGKAVEAKTVHPTNVSLIDEELQKKIMDNARLIIALSDKDFEISSLHERLNDLEAKVLSEQKEKSDIIDRHKIELKDLKLHFERQLKESESRITSAASIDSVKQNGDVCSDRGSILSSDDGVDVNSVLSATKQQVLQLEQELERCRAECHLLNAKCGTTDAEDEDNNQDENKVKDYFYERINQAVSDKQYFQSMANSLSTECNSLQTRLELYLQEKSLTERKLISSEKLVGRLQEELATTSHNYEQQLSTMSEHLADLNDKYTEQCEQIQQLQYQLGMKTHKGHK